MNVYKRISKMTGIGEHVVKSVLLAETTVAIEEVANSGKFSLKGRCDITGSTTGRFDLSLGKETKIIKVSASVKQGFKSKVNAIGAEYRDESEILTYKGRQISKIDMG